MFVSKSTYWALKALIYLASQPPGSGPHLSAQVAAAVGAPAAGTAKVLRRLSLAGVLASLRGSKGGFLLARSPQDLTVYDVSCAVDGRLPDGHQPAADPALPLAAGLEAFLATAQAQAVAAMRSTTIADLLTDCGRTEAERR
ncbi:MAG: transcriptional regulator [Anaerolineae bacterium]|nr:transcriptional regulator [Anaerolineae bacterium]